VLPYVLNAKAAGATATTDTGVLVLNQDGSLQDKAAREGQAMTGLLGATPSSEPGVFGQFFSRAAVGADAAIQFYGYPAYWLPDGETTALQSLFADRFNGLEVASIGQGNSALGMDPAILFQSVLGETMDSFSWFLYRGTVSGPGVTKSNNEVLWHENVPAQPLMRKGDEVLGIDSGIFISRFLKFWPVDTGTAIVLAKLSGKGVSSKNDCIVFLVQDDLTLLPLMREGDIACDWDCPRIGVIQQVEVEPSTGRYLIQASLTGASTRNQALFAGSAGYGDSGTGKFKRLPAMVLRKGARFDTGFSDVTTVKSILIEPRTDKNGAGGKGLGSILTAAGYGVITIQFQNGAKELVSGLLVP
ncbi:MAG: hypothetical protein KDL87_12505, partial [Verrucomicrobiae bacterium]|nr:hypothetical protein [Verrucomicrobiae bacterium]